MANQELKQLNKAHNIVLAALEQFDQKGFLATSLEDIAANAGIGKSTVYEYFKNKEELFIAAVNEACGQWLVLIEDIGKQTKDPIKRLESVMEAFIDHTQHTQCQDHDQCQCIGEQRLFFEVVMQSVMKDGVFFKHRYLIRNIHQRFIRIIANYILDGVSSGRLKPDVARDAEKIAVTFWAFLDGMKLYNMAAVDYIDIRGQIRFFMQNLRSMLQPCD